jgi:hypothetical protein
VLGKSFSVSGKRKGGSTHTDNMNRDTYTNIHRDAHNTHTEKQNTEKEVNGSSYR